MRMMFVVTHLLGTGHLSRALKLAQAAAQAGHDVTLVSGGLAVPHLDADGVTVVQLPALQSDGVNFARLLDDTGHPVTQDVLRARELLLISTLHACAPDVLLTELFPFGRRILKDEFLALLAAASALQPRPVIASSVRDILAPPSKPRKAQQAEAWIEQFYDAVLVHSDPDLTPLEASWPVTPPIARRLQYTGYVTDRPHADPKDETATPRVLVSVGGGNVGRPVLDAAVAAAHADPDRQWHLLVGGANAHGTVETLRTAAPQNCLIEPARPDFRRLLAQSAASVSLCGYNTALDVLQTDVPAVFVPFDDGGEVEQTLRAQALSQQPGITLLRSIDLTAKALLQAVKDVTAAPPRPKRETGFDGAAQTVRILQTLRDGRR